MQQSALKTSLATLLKIVPLKRSHFFSEDRFFSKVSSHAFVSSMVTKNNQTRVAHKLQNSLMTPNAGGDTGERIRKRARLSSPLAPHAITNLRVVEEQEVELDEIDDDDECSDCLLYTSPSPRDLSTSRMPSSA